LKTPRLSRRARSRALALVLLATPPLALLPATAHAAQAAGAPCGAAYTVRPGDSLWSVEAACGVPVTTIQRLNRLGHYLQPGQTLRLTTPYAAATPVYVNTARTYVVRPGDTLSGIGLRLGVAPAALAAANELGGGNLVRVGQVLRWGRSASVAGVAGAVTTAPSPAAASTGATYRVRPGDTLWGIAAAQGLTPAALAAANGITNGRLLRVGMVLRLSRSTPSQQVAGYTSASASPSTSTAAPTTTIVDSGSYRVKIGDTLSGIATALGLTPSLLARSNGLSLAQPIRPGELLRYAIMLYSGPSRAEVSSVLDSQATAIGLDPTLLKAIAWRESAWRMVDASDGGIGVMQLMPGTVDWLKSAFVPGLWDPHTLAGNVRAGAILLLFYNRIYGGDSVKVATAYHGGMGVVGRRPTREMTHYITTVLDYQRAFQQGIFPYSD